VTTPISPQLQSMQCMHVSSCTLWSLCTTQGPSIYDVHSEGGQAQVDALCIGRGSAPQFRLNVHTEN